MSIPIQKFREIVFQVLYSIEIGESNDEALIGLIMRELCTTKKTVQDAITRAKEIWQSRADLDEKISQYSVSYSFDRIPTVEKNILRLALFELLVDKTIPPKVAIAEAIRLARKFSTPESASFINAILDQLYKSQFYKSQLSEEPLS